MLLKENTSEQKLRGSYYTPKLLADFIVKHLNINNNSTILEPSCGNGVFLESIRAIFGDKKNIILDAIEINKDEANYVSCNFKKEQFNIINEDFFDFYNRNSKKRYNVIVGNPPYIRYQYLTKEQREVQSEILIKNDMKPNKLINSWVCFFVACIELLDNYGDIAFVIPAELLQITYAEELRFFLTKHLSKIILITFKELIFPNIQQEVVVLFGKKKKTDTCNICVLEFSNLSNMIEFDFEKLKFQKVENSKEKWTKYFLSSDENKLIKKIIKNKNFLKFRDIALINVGVTTGNNKYFSVNSNIVEEYKLENVILPLIGRGSHVKGVCFTKNDWIENIRKMKNSFLICFSNELKFDKYPIEHKEYILKGVSDGDNKGYKIGLRNNWYVVPSIWIPDAFFLRRNDIYPKFVVNDCNAISTDIMHRVKFNDGIDKNKALLSYYNSVSFAFTEIYGRSYGGGVLEILPSEVNNIVLPNLSGLSAELTQKYFDYLDKSMRDNLNIEVILDVLDKVILVEYLGMSVHVVTMIRGIWKKLMMRRKNRNVK